MLTAGRAHAGAMISRRDVEAAAARIASRVRRTPVFDAGPAFSDVSDAGRSEVVPYLLSQGVHELDLMVISHADMPVPAPVHR